MAKAEPDWVKRDREQREREHARKCARILKTPELLHGIYKDCGIASEFWNAKPEDFPKGVVANAIGILQEGKRRSLYLFGKPGRGKTHFCSVVCRRFIDRDLVDALGKVCFVSLTQILLHIRAGFDEKRSEERTLAEYIHKNLLCIDDIGVTRTSEFTREAFFYIADYRWRYNLPTVYITDQHYVRMLNELFTKKIMSRIYHNRIHFKGRDRRQDNTPAIEVQE